MSEPSGGGTGGTPHVATVTKGLRFSPIWIIPIVAVGLLIYLGYMTLSKRGPLITLTFSAADGLTAEQTQVKHKAVTLGTVQDIALADDMSHVIVHVRMEAQAREILTDHARFWVVRPRLSTGSISGLETIVSGAYIAFDPGAPGGKPQRDFKGLEEPPGVRSDEPGQVFALKAERLGSLSAGAPIFYRDVTVGEVLNYDMGDGKGEITMRAFIRSPYDRYVHPTTRFWNASGLSVNMGPEGMHIELASIQAVLAGGVAFETSAAQENTPAAPANFAFSLYENKARADAASYKEKIPYVSYFQNSVQGLTEGSPVQIFGVQVGSVTEVRLVVSPDRGGSPAPAPSPSSADQKGQFLARVAFEIQPERVMKSDDFKNVGPPAVMRSLVEGGLRVVLESSSFLTGSKVLSLQYVPGVKPEPVRQEGDTTVLPSQGGGLDNITSSLSDIATKLDHLPFAEMGDHLNKTLASVDSIVGGPELHDSLTSLAATMKNAQHLVGNADAKLGPALDRLPAIANDLQGAVEKANRALGDRGYGENSEVQREVVRLLGQVNDTMRTVRLLADFLERHPEALIQGRSEK